jgi:hypothetical protein
MAGLHMPDGFLSISEIISKEPGFEKLRKVIKQHDVIIGFHKIFPDLKKIAIPVKIERKVLHIRVQNAAWRSELKFNQETMIEKINSFYKEEIIKAIRLQS